MAAEIEGSGIPFTDIHINLTEQTITLKKRKQLSRPWYLTGNYQHQALFSLATTSLASPTVLLLKREQYRSPLPLLPPGQTLPKSGKKTITLSGKLKSQPKSGKADRSGKPTAYADFAAHVEGEQDAHDYIATFHRHTRDIALKLPTEAQITVSGYPHASNSPKRKDTISVVNIVEYPGKPPLRPKKR